MATAPQSVSFPVLQPRPRVLGADLAPARQVYYMFIPGLLFFIGILTWIMGDEQGMVVAGFVGTMVAVFTLWDWLFRHAPTRFSTLLAMSLLLGYAMGAINTWITLPRGTLTIAELMGLGEGALARGMAAVLFSTATLYFFGEVFEKPVFGRDFRFDVTHRTRQLIYVGTLAMLAGYASHSLSIEGAASAEGHVSIPGLFLNWLYPPLASLAVAAFLTAHTKRERVLTGLSSLVLLAMFSLMGRRISIYTSMEILLVMGLVGFRWRGRLFQKIVVISVFGAVIVTGALTFMVLRIAGGLNPQKQLTVAKRIEVASKLVQKGGAYAQATKATQQNVQTRTFVLAFLANVMDAASRQTPALGRDAYNLSASAVPSIILPNKGFPPEEALVDQVFGLSYGDQANSILTTGATDFGFIGVMIYPLILVFLLRATFDIIAKWFSTVTLMVVALSFICILLQAENILTGYLEVMRDAALFGAVVAIFMALPAFRLSRD